MSWATRCSIPGGEAHDAVVREFGPAILARRRPHRPRGAGAQVFSRPGAAGAAQQPGASAGIAPRRGTDRRAIAAARSGWNRRGGGRHSDRGRQYRRFDRIIVVTCGEEQQMERAMRRAGRRGSRRAGAPRPADAARRETKIRRFRHRYIRGKRGYAAANPGRLRSLTETRIMKVPRPLLWAVVLAAGFLYLTSGTHLGCGAVHTAVDFRREGCGPNRPRPPPSTRADEQNNIDIYRTGREATVNITSMVYRRDWFFQVYPREGHRFGIHHQAHGRDSHQQSRGQRRAGS